MHIGRADKNKKPRPVKNGAGFSFAGWQCPTKYPLLAPVNGGQCHPTFPLTLPSPTRGEGVSYNPPQSPFEKGGRRNKKPAPSKTGRANKA